MRRCRRQLRRNRHPGGHVRHADVTMDAAGQHGRPVNDATQLNA
jgi:hypothetical protein